MSARLEELASACIWPGVEGLAAPDWVRREIAGGLGGVVLFSRNVRDAGQLAGFTAALRAEDDRVLVSLDEEGGDVTRLEAEDGSSFPGALALGAVDDTGLTCRVAAALGARLAAVGVNLDLAPVADVNTNPRNPVIGVRSFGSDPELVARHVAAFVAGLQEQGVAACAKHFPGHGATSADSHHELPTIEAGLDELRSRELEPFRAAIASGVAAIMTAHILVPAVDAVPATISGVHLGQLLREELGFRGLVVTDALEMKAISGTVGVERGAVLALAAGADALCLGHDLFGDAVAAVRAAIVRAVVAGELAEERLAEAAARVRATAPASRGGGPVPPPGDPVGLEAARRALRVEGEVQLSRPALVVECVPEPGMAAGPARHGLGVILEERDARTRSLRVEPGPAAVPLPDPDGRTPVLVLRDAIRHDWERELADRLVAARADTVVVDVGYPGWRPDGAAGYLTTYGAGRASLAAAAELLAAADPS
jgi:beta-N-acetylhexosaminidase